MRWFFKFIINLLKSYVNVQKLIILSSVNLKRKLLHKFSDFYTKIKWQWIFNQENYKSKKKETSEVKSEKICNYTDKSLYDLKDWIYLCENAFYLKEYKKNSI